MFHAAQYATPAQEMRAIVGEAMGARDSLKRDAAAHAAARDLRLSSRRVLAILRGEVARVWADELDHARIWYAHHCEKQAAIRAHQSAQYEELAQTLKQKLR